MKTPFNMIIVGMTECAKTYYLLKMLERECMNNYKNIILLCPTFEWNRTYQDWKYTSHLDVIDISCD